MKAIERREKVKCDSLVSVGNHDLLQSTNTLANMIADIALTCQKKQAELYRGTLDRMRAVRIGEAHVWKLIFQCFIIVHEFSSKHVRTERSFALSISEYCKSQISATRFLA